MTHLVFTYGTLKKGFHNHHYLQQSTFIGSGKTQNKYALYINGGLPFVVRDQSVSLIYGEVYRVDDSVLAVLDQLEGHPDWYCREKVNIVLDADSSVVSAWLYFNPDCNGELVTEGAY